VANFYSDTQTLPTRAMREAVLAADVGDEQANADPTTNALCARVAELLGQEAAVFMPSGTMCNEIAIAVHCRPGDEIICARQSHIIGFEGGGPAALAGAMTSPIDTADGTFTDEQVRAAIRPESRYFPRTRLVSVEQTVNIAGGVVWPVDRLRAVAEVAKNAGLASHMDGARLLNAVVASGVPASEFAGPFDSVWIDFTKGLGAPIGAVLAGSDAFIAEAWRFKQRWGGAMRQSGIAAAMCLYALDHHVARLDEDHALARSVAERLEALPGLTSVTRPETNIVFFDIAEGGPSADELGADLAEEGIKVCPFGGQRVRIVTHLDVGHDDGERLVAALARRFC
jgi:threonine aldolase